MDHKRQSLLRRYGQGRGAEWYQDKLGFTLLNAKSYPDLGTRILFLEWNGFKLELIEDKAIQRAARRPNPPEHTRLPGVAQFSFTVDDLNEVAGLLQSRGVALVWGPMSYPDLGLKFLFFRDGDGNLIQLLQLLK